MARKFPVLSPIMVDKKYEIDDVIELEDNQIDELKFYDAIGDEITDDSKGKK